MAHIQPSDTALSEETTALYQSADHPSDAAAETEGLDLETLAAFEQILDDQLQISWMQDRQRWQA